MDCSRALFVACLCLLFVGCANMTPTQKKWTGIATGVLIVGAIAAHQADSGNTEAGLAVTAPSKPCTMQPNGTCR